MQPLDRHNNIELEGIGLAFLELSNCNPNLQTIFTIESKISKLVEKFLSPLKITLFANLG